jgi:hypothetical protein
VKRRVYKEANGFCYDILTDGDDLLIRQDGKPAVGGIAGFATKAEADIKEEIKAVKEAIEKAKKEYKPKNLQ